MKKSLTNWTPDSEPTLKFIDFKLGNVCNLKCRICGSWSSSKWAQEELDYGENPVARKNLLEGKRCDSPCTECNAEGTILGKKHAEEWRKIYKIS